MSANADTPEIKAEEMRDVSALADGSIDPARRDAVEARIAASPELSALYAREQRVVDLLHQRASDRSGAGRRSAPGSRPSGRSARSPPAVGSATAAVWSAHWRSPRSRSRFCCPAARPARRRSAKLPRWRRAARRWPAPAADPDQPGKLQTLIEGIYFPDWSLAFHWRASGQRTDTINGRRAVTVYYDWKGHRLAYTIVGSPALNTPTARVTTLKGVELHTLTIGGRLVVTWKRGNNTCVLSATGIPAAKLQKLAAWEASAA